MIRALLIGCTVLPVATAAQDVDVDALIATIDQRAGQYIQLTQILQGADSTRALAAFDVMLESNNKTMRETAISAAVTATDERLRARALWETLVDKDSFTITINTEGLDKEGRAALDGWIGATSTWGITERVPETQCLNLSRGSDQCHVSYHLSVSGLKVDMRYANVATGEFTLNAEGILEGEIMNASSKAVYPATVQLR